MATEKGLRLARNLWSWEPHSDGQREWMLSPAKIKVGACGRRWGKSESTGIDIILYALENPNTIQTILAPEEENTREITEKIETFLAAIPGMEDSYRIIKSPSWRCVFDDAKRLTRPTTIRARTLGSEGKGVRGRNAHRVIVDEAAFVADEIMERVITPLLADYDGDLILISTPAGRNHFWRDFTRGKDPAFGRYASFQFPSAQNPHLPRAYLENEKATKPERTWRIEYLAEFADEEGSVFRNVAEAVDKGREQNEPPQTGRRYTMGADIARVEDFTVLTVTEDTTGRQVYHERFNQISWERQISAIVRVARLYNALTVLDSTGVGDPIFEAVRKAGVNVAGFHFTSASKEGLIDNLAMRIEQGQARLMDVPVQTNELLAYQYELTPSRNVRMNAPAGMHDDCVISLALSHHRPPQEPQQAMVIGNRR